MLHEVIARVHMTKEMFYTMARPEHKVMVGFCSTTVFCLLLLILLHVTSNSTVIPCGGEDCKMGSLSVAVAKQEHIRQVVANLKEGENSTSESQEREGVVKVLEEWRLPSVTNDRPREKLDSEKYGEARRFMPIGSGAFLFIQFGAYRGGPNSFAVVGLGTKGLHKHGNPGFKCSWVSNKDNCTVQGNTTKYYPDWDYGKQYSVVVVNCTFKSGVGVDKSGGRLQMVATHGSSDHTGLPDVHFVALTEERNKYDASIYAPPYKYDYLYCGSPIYGSVNPQRMREWIAYHVRFLGPRSHFMLYDAGGIQDDVRRILEPWIKLGFITLMNVRQEARYDDYYYSQFLINNDCIFQGKTLAKWAFFFDLDEYVAVPKNTTLAKVMTGYNKKGRRRTQVLFKQNFMVPDHCRNDSLSQHDLQRQWGFEKLVYKRTQWTKDMAKVLSNRKYVIQPRYALSGGVHLSEHTLDPKGWLHKETFVYEDQRLFYYHYHNTITNREELCKEFVDPALKELKIGGANHALDNTIARLGRAVREFENRTIGLQHFLPNEAR